MIVSHKDKLEAALVNSPEAKGADIKVLVSPKEGWEGHVMRVLSVEEGGYTPRHSHPWPHINYIISGKGSLFLDGKENEIQAGSYAYVPSGEIHQFQNTGQGKLEFICIVPEEGHV